MQTAVNSIRLSTYNIRNNYNIRAKNKQIERVYASLNIAPKTLTSSAEVMYKAQRYISTIQLKIIQKIIIEITEYIGLIIHGIIHKEK